MSTASEIGDDRTSWTDSDLKAWLAQRAIDVLSPAELLEQLSR